MRVAIKVVAALNSRVCRCPKSTGSAPPLCLAGVRGSLQGVLAKSPAGTHPKLRSRALRNAEILARDGTFATAHLPTQRQHRQDAF